MPNDRMSPERHGQEGRNHDDFRAERGAADRHMEHHRSERYSVVDVRTGYDRPPYRILRPVPTPIDLPIQYMPGANGNPTATVNLVTGSPSTSTTTVTTGPVTSGAPSGATAAANAAQAYAASQAIANLGAMTVKYDATTQDAQPSVTLASPNGAGPRRDSQCRAGRCGFGCGDDRAAQPDGRCDQLASGAGREGNLQREVSRARRRRYRDGDGFSSLRRPGRPRFPRVRLGNYAGTTALATGLNYNVTEALRVNANAAYVPNTRNVGFGLGATYTFW
jgi:hypothetical protein